MNDSAEPERTDRLVCPAAKDPAVRLFILAAMLIGFGLWCLTDRRQPPEAWDMKHLNQAGGYLLNNWGPFLLLPGGLVSLVWGVVFLRRKLVATAEGIGYLGKQTIPWEKVTRLDASRLQDKGILYLHHGGARPLVLDGWKLSNFKAMVAFAEQHVPPEAIETASGD
jgi:hypothetical protein